MSNFNYQIIQGIRFPIRVYSGNSILIIKGANSILTFNYVTEDQEHDLWLNVLIDQDNYIAGGIYQFQLFENNLLKQQGMLKVIPSLLVDPEQDLRSKYKIIIEAIQKQLAGVATTAQRHVQVGDKTIDKYNANDLLKLLSYFQGKLDEQEAGNDINAKTDQLKIKYKWSWR